MPKFTKRKAAVAVLAAAAIAAPTASAQPVESFLPSSVNASGDTSTVAASNDFDWGDAGIGAAGALSLLGLGTGAVVIGRRSRRSRPATS
jgi:hypothetical protein